MADTAKVVINLATGLEDAERVTVAFLVGGAAVERGKQVTMFLTKEAVRLALPGYAEAVACDGCPPLARLVEQYAERRRKPARLSHLLQRPQARTRVSSSRTRSVGGATPLWEWIGDERRDGLQLLIWAPSLVAALTERDFWPARRHARAGRAHARADPARPRRASQERSLQPRGSPEFIT